jgi:hypothetical protein
MRKRIALMLIAALATLVAIHAQLALATPTGTNGRIVYTHFVPALDGTVIRTVNPDGSQVRRVLPFTLECPHWSADGTRIATCGSPNGGAAVIVNPDTGRYRELAMPDPTLFTGCPVWSPDGRRLACEGFGQTDPGRNGIYTIRSSDGKGLRRTALRQSASPPWPKPGLALRGAGQGGGVGVAEVCSHRQDRAHDVRVELGAAIAEQFGAGFVERHCGAVWPVGGHGAVGVAAADDPRHERDSLTC